MGNAHFQECVYTFTSKDGQEFSDASQSLWQ